MRIAALKRLMIIYVLGLGLGLLGAAGLYPAGVEAAPLHQASCTLPATVTTAAQLGACITEANANGAGLDTITLGANITLSAALPQITTAITLEGAGYFIDGGDSIQLFNVGTAGDFTVNQATLQSGSASNGGAFYNDGTLTLTNSTLSGNTATINGGAIYNDGRLTLNNSTLSANTATNGGAIYNVIQSTVTATNSTFSGNIATNHGAAVYNYSSATVKATNSTFSGNSATNSGGGVYNRGRLTLTSSTFTGNAATTASSIYNDSTGILHLAGNLFAATGDNCSSIGTLNDNGYNLSDDATCTNGGFGSLTNATLNLGALTDNGGLTLTHLPGAGSDAIGAIPYGTTISNNGTSWTCDQSVTDQRGEPRPIDSGDGCTAGAVEVPLCPSWTATTAAELYQCILKANGNESPSPTADTITLGANIDLTTLTAAPLPQITSEITLEGANHVIDGGNSVQLFYVDAGGDFTVNQATLQNGSANDTSDINGDGVNGGGINNNGKLTVTNSTISGNTAVASGGGIFNGAYGTLAVANSTISGNTATGDTATATPGYGGGIYSFNATMTLTNSTISNNTAAAGGGGIYLNRGTATVTGSTISGNSATNGGGGININSYGTVAVTNSTISANSAANGGGIKNSSTATVTDSTISDNTATGGGGGIDNDSTLTVTNSTISANTVTGTGDGGGINNSGTATVTDSTLHSNTANRRGAGINNSGTLTVTTSTFSSNYATTRGGGIYNNGGTVTVTISTFYRNYATAIGVGGVYNNGGTVHLAGVILDNGTSGANCSASITDNGYNLSDDASCGFSGTSANMVSLNLSTISHTTTPGQQVHTPQTGSNAIGAIPYGTTINNNGVTLACNQTATDQLGADRPITAFTACTAGAVEVTMPPICTSWTVTTADELYDCIIVANNNESPSPTADTITLGANINLTTLTTSPLPQITSAITLEGANHVIDGGNSVQLFFVNSGGDFTVNQATLQNGFAISGGGIRNYGTVTVSNSTISGNTATGDGGGIDNYQGTLTVTNSTISGNSAGDFGGGIGNGGMLTVTNSTISNNTATGDGGGIDNYTGMVTVVGSTISGNTADYGGGIFNDSGTLTVTNSTVSGNSATNSGGGIDNRSTGTVMVTNSTFSGNSADNGSGGGIHINTGTVTVTNSTFSGNSAATVGGGIANSNGPLTVTNSTFSGNTAAIQGGGIYQDISGSNPVYLAGVILVRGTSGANCSGFVRVSDNGYNLSSDGSCGFTGTGSANNATLNLGVLSGGVHTPQTGSDAIGAIPNGTSVNNNGVTLACNGTTTDQLGADRPINIGTACTSGAVEVAMPPICTSWTVTSAAELSDCITLANGNENPSPTADTITLGANITLSTALP